MLRIGDVADVVQLLESPRRRGDETERAPAADHGWRHVACGSRLANRGDCHGAAALDGKPGRDQQQSNGGEVTDINAVRRSGETRTSPFGKGSTITSPMATATSTRAWSLRRRRWVGLDTSRG